MENAPRRRHEHAQLVGGEPGDMIASDDINIQIVHESMKVDFLAGHFDGGMRACNALLHSGEESEEASHANATSERVLLSQSLKFLCR